MPYTEYTLWLLPSEPLRSVLRGTINQLAIDLDAIPFEPHVTVFCGPGSDAEAREAAHQIGKQFAPIALTPSGLEHTDRYTKTLFVQFQESADLRRIFGVAQRLYAPGSVYTLNPHLSLIYKKLPERQRQKLSITVNVPIAAYGFDRIRVIQTELPIEDSGPVKRWRTVHEVALSA